MCARDGTGTIEVCLSKKGAPAKKRSGNTGVGAGKILGVRKIFARIFLNFPEKVWATLPIIFPSKIMKTFFG